MPIRILHFSDAHVGVESYGRIDPRTGVNSRLRDYQDRLDEVVTRAIQGDVDVVLFTGDAYRGRDPNATHQRTFASRIHRISGAGIPVFLLVGNHDLPAATGRANAVDIFETLEVPNVYVGREPRLHRVETRKGPIQVYGLPWITQSRLFAREELRELTTAEIRQRIQDFCANSVLQAAEDLDPSLPAVLAAHVQIQGVTYSSGQGITVGQDVILPRSAVANPAFDYVALGHIHKHQVVTDRPLTIYAGSIERIDFGEESEDKGFVLVDVEKGSATYEFVKVNARRFLTVRVNGLDGDPTEAALEELARHDLADAVVRVEVTTTYDLEGKVDYSQIRRALGDAYYVAGISKRVELRRDGVRVPGLDQVAPYEALERYLESRQTPRDRMAALLERGKRLIVEVEAARLGLVASSDGVGGA